MASGKFCATKVEMISFWFSMEVLSWSFLRLPKYGYSRRFSMLFTSLLIDEDIIEHAEEKYKGRDCENRGKNRLDKMQGAKTVRILSSPC